MIYFIRLEVMSDSKRCREVNHIPAKMRLKKRNHNLRIKEAKIL